MPANKKRLFNTMLSGMTPFPSPLCPLCDTTNADFVSMNAANLRVFQGWCPACTNVRISGDAVEKVRREKRAHLLASFLRKLPAEDWDAEVGTVASDNIEKLISSVAESSVLDQFDLALKVIAEMCPMIGEASTFNFEVDWPLVTARSPRSALYIMRELCNAGYLQPDFEGNPFPPKPTWKAYERLQEIQSSGRNSDSGFVAMSFSASQLPVWKEVLEPGIWDAGYEPIRVDQYEHSERIDDEIIARIRRCRFLVADFTEQKRGVYFEAGLALGLGRNVIWMCKDSQKDQLNFDTRQFNHILYENPPFARRALTNRIVALEGPGRLTRPTVRS